jgi:thiamine biosynthesis lipoprotein
MTAEETFWTDRAFRVMGTRARILVCGGPDGLAARGEELARALEARWTRFDTESELMRLNARAGSPVRVSEPTFALVARAVDAWRRTAGRFDPTGLDALVAAGYDRDFAALSADSSDSSQVDTNAVAAQDPGRLPGCRGIVVDPLVAAVTLPRGVHLDLGGIGKGYAADRVVAALIEAGATGACVDLGGDVRVAGAGPYDGGWRVESVVPEIADRFGAIRLASGAVATSTTTRRRWTRQGVVEHHLLDPATGRASRSGVATVTVVAADAWWAEVLAKAALVAGPAAGTALLVAESVDGVLVTDAGAVRATPGFAGWCTATARAAASDTPAPERVTSGAGTRSS